MDVWKSPETTGFGQSEARTERHAQQGQTRVSFGIRSLGLARSGVCVVPQNPAEMAARVEVGRGSSVQLRGGEPDSGERWGVQRSGA